MVTIRMSACLILITTLSGCATESTRDPHYRRAAEDALRYVFDNLQFENGLYTWGSHSFYHDYLRGKRVFDNVVWDERT